MTSRRYYSVTQKAAKEKNKRLFPDILSGSRLKQSFSPLAAKQKNEGEKERRREGENNG